VKAPKPEPLTLYAGGRSAIKGIATPIGPMLFNADTDSGAAEPMAERIIAAYNATYAAGINPEAIANAVTVMEGLQPHCEECGRPATHKQPWTEGYWVCRYHADCDVVLRNPSRHPLTLAIAKLKGTAP